MAQQKQTDAARSMNKQMMGKLLIIAVLMFCFGYVLIPVYKKIC